MQGIIQGSIQGIIQGIIQGVINDIRKELSVLVEIKRDNRKVQNRKRTGLFKKYKIEKEEDLNRLIEELNTLNPELNPICYLLALLGAHHFLHVSRIRVKLLIFRRLMSYIYMEHLFLMFLDHTQRRSTVGRTPLDE